MEASPVAKSDCGSTRASSELRLSSTFLKQVSLHDWWLIRTDAFSGERGVGVGGLVSDKQVGLRVFCSAAIVGRETSNVLKTYDGITVTLVGSINRSCTIQNGFSSEVCHHFLFGFPYYWEEFAGESLADGSSYRADSPSSSLPELIDNLPLVLMRDFVFPSCQVSGVCELQKSILANIERTCADNALHRDACFVSPKEVNGPVTSRDSQEHKISSKKSNIVTKHKIKECVSIAQLRAEKFQRISSEDNASVTIDNSRWGHSTRSMSHSNTEGAKQGKNFIPDSLVKSTLSKSISVSDAPRKQHGESFNAENVPNLNVAEIKDRVSVEQLRTERFQEITSKEDTGVDFGKPGWRSSTRSMSCLNSEGAQQEKNFLSSSLMKSPLSKSVSVSGARRKQHGESVNVENVPNLNPTARKLTLRNHSTRTISCMEIGGSQKEKNVLSGSSRKKPIKKKPIKLVPVSDITSKNSGGSVGGRNAAGVTMTTRKLTLRNRSVDLHIVGLS